MSREELREALCTAKSLSAHVNHWANWRRVYVTSKIVIFQITVGCSHCPTCQSRWRDVEAGLRRSGAESNIQVIDGVAYLILARKDEDPLVTIAKATGIQLRLG